MANLLFRPFINWLGKLSYPRLFVVIAILFVIDLFIIDFVPWDDVGLGLATLLLARLKKRKQPQADVIEHPTQK